MHIINMPWILASLFPSYTGGPGVKSQPGDQQLSWLRFFVVLLNPSRQMSRRYLKIKPRSLPSTSIPIHSSIILSFYAI
jgi:hypothetical protein